MNLRSVIAVRGTKKSEAAGGLDAGEASSFAIEPGQYASDVNSPGDLIAMIDRNAYLRGEWISSLQIGDVDVVQRIMQEVLGECRGDCSMAAVSLLEMGLFSHADGDELLAMLQSVSNE